MESFYFPALNLIPKGKIFSPENLSQASIPTKKRRSLMARMRSQDQSSSRESFLHHIRSLPIWHLFSSEILLHGENLFQNKVSLTEFSRANVLVISLHHSLLVHLTMANSFQPLFFN
ncbi:hypothetical protein CXB51_015593 [Gossypium anomalum]|uniref:Uncharacterized protein n=1 Tax=Gossypium anomalum TaxID=47600 RepID=A0A8J5YGG1_9ROSI|nr:hypothetical protein CXB51_015593 [Gossypium anomalum]